MVNFILADQAELREELLEAAAELSYADEARAECHRLSRDEDLWYQSRDLYQNAEAILQALESTLSSEAVSSLKNTLRSEWSRFPTLIPELSDQEVRREHSVLKCATRLLWGFKSAEYHFFERELRRTPEWKRFTGITEKRKEARTKASKRKLLQKAFPTRTVNSSDKTMSFFSKTPDIDQKKVVDFFRKK